MATQNEIRQQITDQIVAALEKGGLPPWRKPWRSDPNAGHPANFVSKKGYSGINPLILELAAHRHGLTSRWWGTFRQWEEVGGRVKKRPASVPSGQWGTNIVYFSKVTKAKKDQKEDEPEDRFFLMKTYTIFNADQVEGPFEHLRVGTTPLVDTVQERCQRADDLIEGTGAKIVVEGQQASYIPSLDLIRMPPREAFGMPEYYETVFHELVHWTEKSERLNWDRSKDGNNYAMGELIAEIGSCYVSNDIGLPQGKDLTNHLAYLSHWLSAMKSDPRFIFKAATQASKAADYLLAFAPMAEPAIAV